MGLFLLSALLLFQQDATVPKAQKSVYLKAVKACDRAAEKIEGDPRAAIEIFDSILSNSKVEKREVRLRIQISGGSYSRKYDFFPYQFRGQARLVLAKKEEERGVALDLLRKAEQDFKESVRRGLKASSEYLKDVETERERWKEVIPPTDPEPEFKREWKDLLEQDRFLDAKTHVEEKGKFLSKEKREGYLSKTENACWAMVENRLQVFLRQLEKVRTLEYMREIGSATFADSFALPAKSQLVVRFPVLDWCISVRETLYLMRQPGDFLDQLIAHAEASVDLVREGENGWFNCMEFLAYLIVKRELNFIVTSAKDAPRMERERLRITGKRLQSKWLEFEVAVFSRSGGRLAKRRMVYSWEKHFPLEVEGLNKVQEDLLACAESDNPVGSVFVIENALRKNKVQWTRFSIESRRFLLQHLIVAIAIGKFLKGKTVEESIWELREFGKELKALGGDFKVKLFGAKVEKVFQGLRKQS